MKSLLKPYLVCLSITVMILNYGCKKSDTLDTDMGLTKVKVYDDTLASFKNSSGRIASATDRIYMTYGLGADDLYVIYASGYAANPAITKLNALDNKGNLLWQKTLPTNIVIKGLLAMDDGGCLLAGVNLLENPILQNLFFYRYDRNGSEIITDSVPFPAGGLNAFLYGSLGLMRSANGNILFYGNFLQDGSQSTIFAAEYDLNLNLRWNQIYQFYGESFMTGCAITPDRGYLFAGYKRSVSSGLLYPYSVFLLKTNALGDTLWTKNFATQDRLNSNSFVALANGNYCLSYTYSVKNSGSAEVGIQQTYIMELNDAGDSLNSAQIDIASQIYNPALVPLDNGGVYALMNSKPTANPIGFLTVSSKQNNSSSVILNASLTPNSGGFFQSQTNEIFGAACKTSDGSIACSGLIQPYGKPYYKPALLIVKQ